MAGASLVPVATIAASGGARTGGTTTHGVLGDANAASWIELWPEAGTCRCTVATPTKPAGAVTKALRINALVSSISANTTKFDIWLEHQGATVSQLLGVQISGTTAAWYASPWTLAPADLTPAQLAALVVNGRRSPTGAWTNLRLRELYAEAIFAAQPTVTLSQSVSGTGTTVTWTPAKGDVDTGDYRWYRAWLKNSGGATVFDTGVVDGPTTFSRTATGLASGTYTWYVQVGHESLPNQPHWSAEATIATTIPVTTRAQVLSVVATPNPATAAVAVTANRDTSKDAWGSVEVEVYDAATATWRPLRNVPTPGADSVTAVDFEAPPDTPLQYRARAIKTDGVTVGDWVLSTPTTYTLAYSRFTPVGRPDLAVSVRLAEPPSRSRGRREARLEVLGGEVVYRQDALGPSEGTFVVLTDDEDDAAALEAAAAVGVVYVAPRALWRFPAGHYRLGNLEEVHLARPLAIGLRHWKVPFTQVRRP